MGSERGSVAVHDIIQRSARDGIDLQRDDGSFPPGRNYTYDEPETPVRTTSHWLEVLTKAYELYPDPAFEDAANGAVDYLLSDEVRPSGFTYHCRNVESKDKCNGVVGQAAPIRALTHAGNVLERPAAKETAEEVFRVHPFSKELGLWEKVEIDGEPLSFDRTLNHQIIFAAAAAGLAPDVEVLEVCIRRFLDTLTSTMQVHGDGLIKHYVRPPLSDVFSAVSRAPKRRYDMFVNEAVFHYYSHSDERRKKERGYQTVNLGALSTLKSVFPEHEFWESKKLLRALDFARDNENDLIERVDAKHGDLLQGISLAKIWYRFGDPSAEEQRRRIAADLDPDADDVSELFDVEQVDENTRAALVSALIDLPNIELQSRENPD